jgi:hypothetical protein
VAQNEKNISETKKRTWHPSVSNLPPLVLFSERGKARTEIVDYHVVVAGAGRGGNCCRRGYTLAGRTKSRRSARSFDTSSGPVCGNSVLQFKRKKRKEKRNHVSAASYSFGR